MTAAQLAPPNAFACHMPWCNGENCGPGTVGTGWHEQLVGTVGVGADGTETVHVWVDLDTEAVTVGRSIGTSVMRTSARMDGDYTASDALALAEVFGRAAALLAAVNGR